MSVILVIRLTGLAGLAYLLGSVPFGLVLTRIFTDHDIIRSGSGNIGANNVRRIAGPTLAAATLIADVAKGSIPVYLADVLSRPCGSISAWAVSLVALCAFMGHLYPLYMGFKNGGKGVATAAGCFAVISPAAAAAALLVYILMVWLTRRSSAGSLVSSAILPVAVYVAEKSAVLTTCAMLMAILIVIRHKDNILRILAGAEPRI
jgi:acyl phosphate:glycerol-3-phosphate acyltransferase